MSSPQDVKKTLDDKFDVVNVINKTYQDSTEYDLNDSLIFLSQVIAKTKVKNKDLVKKNFSKFVECRIVLEEILEDLKKKGGDREMSSEVKANIKKIEEKFKKVTGSILENSQYDDDRERRSLIVKKYKALFRLKRLLADNLKHKERFVKIYQEGYSQYCELQDSRYIQGLWEGIKEVRGAFLEDLYKEIQTQTNSYIEVLYYFDLYFRVCETKTDRKIMNTLLLNFKEKVLDIPYVEKGYFLKETNYLYLKTMLHLDKELQRELTKTLFEKVKEIFSTSPLSFIKIWVDKYQRLISKIDVSLEVSSAYFTILKTLKKELVTQRMTKDRPLDEIYSYCEYFGEMFDKDEKYILCTRFLEVIKEKVDQQEEKDSFISQLHQFDSFLKSSSESYEEFEEFKKDIRTRELRKEIAYLCEFIKRNSSRPLVLMEIVRIINKYPGSYSTILKGAEPVIVKDQVLLYFLHRILEKDCPNQTEESEKLEKQFKFLKDLA